MFLWQSFSSYIPYIYNMQGQRSWPMLAEGDSARKDRLRMLMFSSFEVVYKVSALRSEFQENWRKILLPEALSCISHSFGIFSFVSVGREFLLFKAQETPLITAQNEFRSCASWEPTLQKDSLFVLSLFGGTF